MPRSARSRWTLAATILASSMAFIDGTVVNVALPALQTDLHATITDVQWVIEAYALFLGGLILVGGSFGDQFGRRRVFLAGLVLFTVASAFCGLSPSPGALGGMPSRAWRGAGTPASSPSSVRPRRPRTGPRDWPGQDGAHAAPSAGAGGWLIERELARSFSERRRGRRHRAQLRFRRRARTTRTGAVDWAGADGGGRTRRPARWWRSRPATRSPGTLAPARASLAAPHVGGRPTRCCRSACLVAGLQAGQRAGAPALRRAQHHPSQPMRLIRSIAIRRPRPYRAAAVPI